MVVYLFKQDKDSVLFVGLIDMDPRASSAQASIGSSGLGALSHVYPPMRCSIPMSRGVFCDDGNKLLLSRTSYQVLEDARFPFQFWHFSKVFFEDARSVSFLLCF